MMMLKITEEMRAAARRLLQTPALKISVPDRALLAAISEGKRKLIRGLWWKQVHGTVDQVKLAKLQRLADPARNPNEHERAVADRKLGEFKGRRPPGLPPEAPPLPKVLVRRKPLKRRPAPQTSPRRDLPTPDGGVNKKAETGRGTGGSGGVNKKPKRTGDRHLDKSDRHAPGYMRDYMRRRRAKLRQSADHR
jgi:hypothetical protein